MSKPGSEHGTAGPNAPVVPADLEERIGFLGDWIRKQHGSFNEDALERVAVAAGYTHGEFAAALRSQETRSGDSAGIGPLKKTARWFVLGAYGAVWLFFAIIYLGPSATSYGSGLQTILTIALAIGLAISLIVIQLGRPDPARAGRAMTILLVVPVILLLGVAGSCLPFTGLA